MPALREKSKRTNRLVARIAPEDKALLERAAALEGASLATFVVSHVRTAAQEVIRQHDLIRLNEAESQRFITALLSPPGHPTARFAQALDLYRPLIRSIGAGSCTPQTAHCRPNRASKA